MGGKEDVCLVLLSPRTLAGALTIHTLVSASIIYHFHFFWLAKLVFLLGREAILSRARRSFFSPSASQN